MSAAMLDMLRALARSAPAPESESGEPERLVESGYEINEKTHQKVEPPDKRAPPPPMPKPKYVTSAGDQISEMAENPGFHDHAPPRGGHEKNELNEKTPGCAWAQGYQQLSPNRPAGDVPVHRWRQFVDDCGRFLDNDLVAQAAAAGWTSLDLFGCDRDRPFARVDEMGLFWFVKGGRIVEMKASAAVIETETGARQTYRRKLGSPEQVLAWEFIHRREGMK